MKKWAFLCAAAAGAVLIGCGGSGSKSSSTGSTGSSAGSGRPLAALIKIPNTGSATVYISFLTGQARDPGDLHLVIKNTPIHDSQHGIDAQNANSSAINLNLNQYQIQYSNISIDFANHPQVVNSEAFDLFTLNPYFFATEQPDGSVAQSPSDPGAITPDPFIAENPIPIRLTTFPGRDSILPVFLDNTMFTTINGLEGYNGDQFKTINQPPNPNDPTTSGKIVGFISDFVQFNIGTHYWAGGSTNPLPTLMNSTGNGTATHFYLSGDAYAFSDDTVYDPYYPTNPPSYISKTPPPAGFQVGDGVAGASGTFEELTLNPFNPFDGAMAQPQTPPPTGSATPFPVSPAVNFPGTYDLLQANPTDITGISKIVSTYGKWRNAELVTGLTSTTFDLIIFPNSSDSFTENSPADAVGFAHTKAPDGSVVITNLYAGYAFFTANSGEKPMARLYPLNQFIVGSTNGEIDYDLTNLITATGGTNSDNRFIRNGTYTYDAAASNNTPLPTGFLNSGTFVVFRY